MRWDGGGRKRDLDDAAEESTAELMLVRLEPAGDSDRMLCVQKRELESGPYDEQSEHQDKGQSRKSEQSSWSRRGICCSLGDALGGRCGSSGLSRWLRPREGGYAAEETFRNERRVVAKSGGAVAVERNLDESLDRSQRARRD